MNPGQAGIRLRDDLHRRDLASRSRPWFALTAVFVFLCFLPALRNGFTNWDDQAFVSKNPHIDPATWGFWRWIIHPFDGNWTPLAFLSHGIDYALYGLNPAGHHLTSILFHALNTFLVALVFMQLIRAADSNGFSPGRAEGKFAFTAAVCGALYFGISPLRVESAVWIAERRDVLFLFFGLLSIYFYLSYCSGGNADSPPSGKRRLYLASLFFFACGLASKSMLVTLPLVLLIFDYYPLRRLRRGSSTKDVSSLLREKLPFFVLAGLVSLITLLSQYSTGAVNTMNELPLAARIGSAGYAAIFYLSKSVLPLNLAPLYAIEDYGTLVPLYHLAGCGIVIALTFLFIISAKHSKVFLSLWSYYLITMLPISGLFQAGQQFAADRYTYYPGLAFAMAFGLLCGRIAVGKSRWPGKLQIVRRLSFLLAGAYLLVNVAMLEKQIPVWRDSFSLWNYQLSVDPAGSSSTPYKNRGGAYFQAGNYDRAIADFSKAHEINPLDRSIIYDRGVAYLKAGNYRQAVKDMIVAARMGQELARRFLADNHIDWRSAGTGGTSGRNRQ